MLRRLTRLSWKRFLRPTLRDAAWLLVVVGAFYRAELLRLLPGTDADRSIETGRELDVQIVGRGFLTAKHEASGTTAFFRHGHLKINNCGQLSVGRLVDGWTLDPPITIPQDTQSVAITADGVVRCRLPGVSEPKEVGRLDTATFINDEGLIEIVSGLFVETWESGSPYFLPPGNEGRAALKQGRLESPPPAPSSNVAQRTDRELDLRVRGRGLFMAQKSNAETTAYFRPGRLNLDSNGQFCIGTGDDRWIVQPAITIPADAQRIEIGHDGTVAYHQHMNPQPTMAGQLTLVTFVNEGGLRPVADGGLAETLQSGAPFVLNPGTHGTGFLEQGWLDRSPAPPSAISWSLDTPAVLVAAVALALGLLFAGRKWMRSMGARNRLKMDVSSAAECVATG